MKSVIQRAYSAYKKIGKLAISQLHKMSIRLKERSYRFGYLNKLNNLYALGPIQRDEAILIFGMIKAVRPRCVVEFGFAEGYSARLFLQALDVDARLFSYDISKSAQKKAQKLAKTDKRFELIGKGQEDFDPNDIHREAIDMAFFDASHDLRLNIITFEKIQASLSENFIVLIHDTGLWQKSQMMKCHFDVLRKINHKWIDEERVAHQIGERQFVNYLLNKYEDLNILNIHSTQVLRHGMTLVSKKAPLLV